MLYTKGTRHQLTELKIMQTLKPNDEFRARKDS